MLRTAWLILLALPVAFMLTGPSAAADKGTPEQRQACAPDAMRLCSDFIPDVPKITTCMNAKFSQLSKACQLAMRPKHKHKHHTRRHRKHHAPCKADGDCG
jgi:hypothetical protein